MYKYINYIFLAFIVRLIINIEFKIKIIRKFCYYFDKDYKLDIFIEYLHDYISENYSDMRHINIYKYNLCVYLNDNQFTEKAFSLKSVMNEGKTFKELICM